MGGKGTKRQMLVLVMVMVMEASEVRNGEGVAEEEGYRRLGVIWRALYLGLDASQDTHAAGFITRPDGS